MSTCHALFIFWHVSYVKISSRGLQGESLEQSPRHCRSLERLKVSSCHIDLHVCYAIWSFYHVWRRDNELMLSCRKQACKARTSLQGHFVDFRHVTRTALRFQIFVNSCYLHRGDSSALESTVRSSQTLQKGKHDICGLLSLCASRVNGKSRGAVNFKCELKMNYITLVFHRARCFESLQELQGVVTRCRQRGQTQIHCDMSFPPFREEMLWETPPPIFPYHD